MLKQETKSIQYNSTVYSDSNSSHNNTIHVQENKNNFKEDEEYEWYIK